MIPQLNEIDLNITNRCNLTCSYCSVFVTPVIDQSWELPFEHIVDLFDQFEDLGIKHLRIAGGEPFIRKDIGDILSAVGDRCFSTTVLTNGAALTKPFIDLVESQPSKITLAFSLDGENAVHHNASRGCRSSFRRIVEMADYCEQVGVEHTMMSVVTAQVAPRMPEIVSFSALHGFKLVNFIMLGYAGRATENQASFPIYREWCSAIVNLTKFLKFRAGLPKVSILFPHEDKVPYELYEPLKEASLLEDLEGVWDINWRMHDAAIEKGKSRCLAGYNSLTILPNGDVYGCDLMRNNPGFRVGNVTQDSVRGIFYNSTLLKALRAATEVHGSAHFDGNSTTFSCGQCRAGSDEMRNDLAKNLFNS